MDYILIIIESDGSPTKEFGFHTMEEFSQLMEDDLRAYVSASSKDPVRNWAADVSINVWEAVRADSVFTNNHSEGQWTRYEVRTIGRNGQPIREI